MLLQHPKIEFCYGGGHIGTLFEQVGGGLVEMGADPLRQLPLSERSLADQQVIESAAECVDIGATIGLVAIAGLLRGEIIGRAKNFFVMLAGDRGEGVVVGQGQPEVENLDGAAFVEHQIGWLDVAVHQALLVSALKP